MFILGEENNLEFAMFAECSQICWQLCLQLCTLRILTNSAATTNKSSMGAAIQMELERGDIWGEGEERQKKGKNII